LRAGRGLTASGTLFGVFMSADAASAFLIGRLAQEGRQAVAVLRASPGAVRGLSAVHVFAVDGERLWLVQPRLLGEPAIASVPLGEVQDASVREGTRPQVVLRLGGRTTRYTALDDVDACRRFVAALRG